MIGVQFPAEVRTFSLRHRVQTDSGAHKAYNTMGNTNPFSRVKLTTHVNVVPWLTMLGAIPPFHHMFSWRGV